jgi:3-deoxy-7-phosphoheptulonate synthase
MLPLVSPKTLKKKLPITPSQELWLDTQKTTLLSILNGSLDKRILVLGPCSLHNQESALEIGKKIASLQKEVSDRFFLVMRAYIEKPRTTLGWKGALYGHTQNKPTDIEKGLLWSREVLHALIEEQIPLATEFLDPIASAYFEDLITYGFIGSRTTLSQTHRQLASSLAMPVGFKNTPDGSIHNVINAIKASSEAHLFFHINDDGAVCAKASKGNIFPHLVLRGSDTGPNYEPDALQEAVATLISHNVTKSLLVDCSHGNSLKKIQNQKIVFTSVLEQILSGNQAIRGMMLECHLEEGTQPYSAAPSPNISLTDPCMSFEQTAALIIDAHSILRNCETKSCKVEIIRSVAPQENQAFEGNEKALHQNELNQPIIAESNYDKHSHLQ